MTDFATDFAAAVERLVNKCRNLVDLYDAPYAEADEFGAAVVAVRNLAELVVDASNRAGAPRA